MLNTLPGGFVMFNTDPEDDLFDNLREFAERYGWELSKRDPGPDPRNTTPTMAALMDLSLPLGPTHPDVCEKRAEAVYRDRWKGRGTFGGRGRDSM